MWPSYATILLLAVLLAFPPQAGDGVRQAAVALPGTGLRLELIADEAGPLAMRLWRAERPLAPPGDAVLLDEAWWTPLRPLQPVRQPRLDPALLRRIRAEVAPAATRRLPDRLTAWAVGDVTQDGSEELVLSFRRPFRRTAINITRPRRAWTDQHGLSAHVGLFRPHDLSSVWIAGTLTRPVEALAACDGSLAVAYGRSRRPGVVETGAWRWVVFGFLPTEPLAGAGTPACVDIDGDGRTEPAITGRSVP